MKNNKKGFTLIELLAVIVILAIIALIATPIVLNIISKARKSAAESTVYGAMEALSLAYAESQLDATPLTFPVTVKFEDQKFYLGEDASGTAEADRTFTTKGKMPDKGILTLKEDGTYSAGADADAVIEVGSYKCKITNGKTVTCSVS